MLLRTTVPYDYEVVFPVFNDVHEMNYWSPRYVLLVIFAK